MILSLLISLILTGVTIAQTPSGFSPNVTSQLYVKYSTKEVTPGIALTKAETANKPTIGTTDVILNGTYIFIMIDLDVPGQYANPPAPGTRTTNLHALLTGYKSISSTSTTSPYILRSSDTGPKAYIGPAPPAENPVHPHTYVQLLFAQPDGWTVPTNQTSKVSQGNITQFVSNAGLAGPVRGNWFTVSG